MDADLKNKILKKSREISLKKAAQPQTQTTVQAQPQQTTVQQTQPRVSTNDINNTDIGRMLYGENQEKRNAIIKSKLDNIIQRHNVRLRMAEGSISSGDKNKDKLEDARSALADYARLAYIEEAKRDSSVDLSVINSMKDQDIIDWMTKDDPKAQQAYINFVNKGGFVSDVYKEMMGIDEELEAQMEREKSGRLNNFAGSAIHTIKNQIAGLSDITGLTDWSNKKEQERLQPYLNVSTDEYNKYKNGQISFDDLKKKGVSGVYMDYENDVENGQFRGSIEDYGKAMYNKGMESATQTAQEQALVDDLDQFEYNPEGSGAGAGKFAAEMAEFIAMPTGKLNWLKSTLLSTAEIMGLDILEKGELPTLKEGAEDAAVTAALTSVIDGVLRIPGGVKWVKNLIGGTTPEVKEALGKTTRQQWKEASKTADKGLTATKKKATQYIDKAAQGIQQRIDGIGKKLGETRQNLKGDFKFQDVFDSINSEFKKFEEKGRGKNSAPEIKIDRAGNMSIYNEDALSNVTDDAGVKLLDYIKSEWEAFRNQGRSDGIQSAERLMQDISSKINDAISAGKIKRGDSAVGALLDGIKGGYEKLYAAADKAQKGLGGMFREQRKQFNRTDQYKKFFEKYIGMVKNGGKKNGDKAINDLKELEKTIDWGSKGMSKSEDVIGNFFKILKKDKVIKEDLSSELISLIYAFSLKDPKQLQDLVNTIYPSVPGIEELGLNLVRRKIRSSQAKSFLKKEGGKVKNEPKTVWGGIMDELKGGIKEGINRSPRASLNAGQVELSDY